MVTMILGMMAAALVAIVVLAIVAVPALLSGRRLR
jgi:hypothetical protein